MPSHRRGRSLSEALTLEQLEEGGVVISSINNVSSGKGLKEGDEILGATINFDQLSKEEVSKVLKLMEPFDDKVQVLTRSNRSKSLDNLDQCTKGPGAMLTDSYNKLYNTKIKKFLMDDVPSVEGGYVNGEFTAKPPVQSSSKVNQRNDMGLPRLGVDFGLLKSKTLITDANADSHSYEGSLTDGSNLNLPPLGLGLNGTNLSEAQVPRFKIGARCPDLDLPEDPNVSTTSCMQLQNTDHPSFDNAMRNLENPQIGLEVPEVDVGLKGSNITTPEMGIDLDGRSFCGPSVNSSVPKVAIEGRNQEFKMPTFKLPDLGLSGSSFSGPECDVKHEGTPGKLSLKYSKRLKNPDLNLDDSSSYVKSPQLRLSGISPDSEQGMLGINVSKPDISGTDTDMPLGEIKMSHKKPRISLKSPDLDLDAQSGMLKSDTDVKTPDLRLKTSKLKGGMSAPDANIPKADLKGENWATDAPSVSIKGPSGKYRAPTFRMPKFDLPVIQVPGLNGDLDGLDGQLSGTLPRGSNLKLNAPDINVPNVDLKAQKLKINAPKANLDFPSGDLKMPELHGPDWDVNAPSGKLKMPKFNLSGTLPKGPNLDLNADLNSPDLNPRAPKIKGGIDAPDMDLPDMDLKAPKLDMNTPDVNIGSPKGKLKFPKMKMPKFNLPSLKGPEIDGNLEGPNINTPNVNLKGPKADLDLDISGPSGKFKKPNLNLPDLGLSGPKLEGPNLDLKTPDLDISGPNFSGGINAPDINMPNIDLKAPKLKMDKPNANLDLPSDKVKMPKLDGPDWGVNAPSGKLKMPKFNLSGTLPKGPNLDLNTDLK
ncbi:neuroblast differentiation-associated protein AHNAK-like [Astatotilapia calliptera]|nr:neuroblast differentiation-associated protein AHNAK-like [Astatotilapia calliptera]